MCGAAGVDLGADKFLSADQGKIINGALNREKILLEKI